MKTLKSLPFGLPAIAASLALGMVPSADAQEPYNSLYLQPVASLAQPGSEKTARRTDVKRTANILDRRVDVSVVNSNLVDALQTIVESVDGKVSHTDDIKSYNKRVSFSKKGSSLKEAISTLLKGTGFEAYLVPPGEIVVRRSTGKESAQDTGSIRITVKDASNNKGLLGVSLEMKAANRALVTGDNGSVVFRGIPAGTYEVIARRIGFSTVRQEVKVVAGEVGSIEIRLPVMATSLTEVVTAGAAERAKLEVGTSIATIDVAEIMKTTPVSSVSQLLATHVPGITAIAGSGGVGSPTRIRIRGNTSIEGNNEPIYIIDGVRISNDVSTQQANTIYAGVYGSSGMNDFAQRIDDIDPNMIESIEVLKGPTASTLYGSEAANGVIIIKTKRGKAGPTRWTVRADHRELIQSKNYAYGQRLSGYYPTGNAGINPTCNLTSITNGSCIPTGDILGFNMLQDDRFSPLGRGYTQSFGANVDGGVEKLQFSLSLNRTNQLGNAKLPDVNREYIENSRGGKKLDNDIVRPNARNVNNASARINGIMTDNSDFSIQATFGQSYMRAGNNGMTGVLSEVRTPTDIAPVGGWTDWNGTRSQEVKKFTGVAVVNARPQWRGIALNGSGTFGLDFNLNDDVFYIPRGSCTPLCTSTSDRGVTGYVNAGRASDNVRTIRLVGGGAGSPVDFARIDMRFGMDYSKNNKWNLYGNASGLRLGQMFYAANTVGTIQDIGDARATAGWFYEPTVNIRNKLFLTVGLRADYGSALGDQVIPKYPKWNGSWIVSEETFFPESFRSFVDVFRVRFAYGQAGIMPTSNARVRTYSMSSGFVNDGDSPLTATGTYAQLTGPGNLWVRPERTKEYEGGFEIDFLNQKYGLDVTAFRKETKDAIQGSPLAGSIGAFVTYQSKRNVGHISNSGFEISGYALAIDNPNITYKLNANISRAANKLTKRDPGVVSFISLNAGGDMYTGNQTLVVEGYPLFSRFAYELLGFSDVNGDGYIDLNEVRVGDSLVYVGSPQPKFSGGINHTIGLLNNKLMINANFLYTRGQTQFNAFNKSQKDNILAGQGVGSLQEQACYAASVANGNRRATDWCFFESTNTLRFEALGISFQVPQHLVKRMRAASARVSLNANNLAIWSNYSGVDPNVNTTQVNLNGMEAGAAFARPRELGFSFSVTF